MMRAWARALVRPRVAWGVVVATLVATVVAAFFARRVERDDDLLAFLPRTNPEVALFYDVNRRFGGLDVALVGLAPADPFDGAFLERLRALAKALDDEPAVAHALSIANVEDFAPDLEHGGIRVGYLVDPLPRSAQESAALRLRVMERDHVVGHLVARDASAVILYVFLAHDADPRAVARLVRERVESALPDVPKYWGGAPFIASYIYDLSLADMKRLVPWAIAVIVLMIVLSFRDVVGALLALVSTGIGIVLAHGAMGVARVNANIVLSSMPVILFAVGSAYPVHLLVRFYAGAQGSAAPAEALAAALEDVGPPVAGAGLTTVAGLASFVAMDIVPLRHFGLFTAIGVLAELVLALSFVPAVVRLVGLRGPTLGRSIYAGALARLAGAARARRVPVAAGVLALALAGAVYVWRVEARMETAAFFERDSPPARAEDFLRDKFGGSQFLQIVVAGDLTDPLVLREIAALADALALEPHVSKVTHVGQVLALVNEAMAGERRIPAETAQVQLLYRFLAGRAAVRQLVSDDRAQALVHVKIDTDVSEDVERLLAAVERRVAERAPHGHRIVTDRAEVRRERVLQAELRLVAELAGQSVAIGPDARERLRGVLEAPPPAGDPARARARIEAHLRSEESMLEDPSRAAPVAEALTRLGQAPREAELGAALAAALGRDPADELVGDLAASLPAVLGEIWRQDVARARAASVFAAVGQPLDGALARRLEPALAASLLDLELGTALVPAAGDARPDVVLRHTVSGVPVLHRGLARSVTANQRSSLALSLVPVLVILTLLFRSPASGLFAALPTVLTLLVVYGFMGFRGVHLDIGTSMLGSIIVGAGVDYAIHLLVPWRAAPGEDLRMAALRAAAEAGPAIATNALMVAAGFFVLTLGEARPLQNVGGLTAMAMVTAALFTFVALPALARRSSYRLAERRPPP